MGGCSLFFLLLQACSSLAVFLQAGFKQCTNGLRYPLGSAEHMQKGCWTLERCPWLSVA